MADASWFPQRSCWLQRGRRWRRSSLTLVTFWFWEIRETSASWTHTQWLSSLRWFSTSVDVSVVSTKTSSLLFVMRRERFSFGRTSHNPLLWRTNTLLWWLRSATTRIRSSSSLILKPSLGEKILRKTRKWSVSYSWIRTKLFKCFLTNLNFSSTEASMCSISSRRTSTWYLQSF